MDVGCLTLYVVYTAGHLHQHFVEDKNLATGKQVLEACGNILSYIFIVKENSNNNNKNKSKREIKQNEKKLTFSIHSTGPKIVELLPSG